MKELQIGPKPIVESRRVRLADLGFRYRVSDEAKAQIEANERRSQKVLTTAHLYWFK